MFQTGGTQFTVNETEFLKAFLAKYPRTNTSQSAGVGRLIGFLESDPSIMDVRCAAYILATAKHESAHTFQPVEEFGKGKGLRYGEPVTVNCDGVQRSFVYYGRGYVQITWKENYEKLGQAIGLGSRLVCNPNLALEPSTAYSILSVGMRDGLFRRSHMLSRYINDEVCDYVNARNIVNGGLDKATDIAGYANIFEGLLRESLELP